MPFIKLFKTLNEIGAILREHSLSLSIISEFHDPSEVQTKVCDVVGK